MIKTRQKLFQWNVIARTQETNLLAESLLVEKDFGRDEIGVREKEVVEEIVGNSWRRQDRSMNRSQNDARDGSTHRFWTRRDGSSREGDGGGEMRNSWRRQNRSMNRSQNDARDGSSSRSGVWRRNTTSSEESEGWSTVPSRRGRGHTQQNATSHGDWQSTNRHRSYRSRGRGSRNDQRVAREWMQKLKRHRWNLRDLEECFEMIPKRNTFHFNFVMSVYAKRKNARRVEELFERMIEEKFHARNVFTYNTLMNAYGTNHIEAEKVLKRMKRLISLLMNAYVRVRC